jgi:predicted exporter
MLLRGLACVLLLAAVVVLVLRGVPVHTSLYDLLPSGGGAATQSLDRMARASSRQVNVLIKGDSDQNALAQAQRILENLPSGVTPLTNQNMLAKVAESLHPYRFQLLSTRHRAALSAGDDEALREEALTNLYSFVPLSLYPADVDPYGFVTAFLMENPLVR